MGRKCICNALVATAGAPQVRAQGRLVEAGIVTAGDDPVRDRPLHAPRIDALHGGGRRRRDHAGRPAWIRRPSDASNGDTFHFHLTEEMNVTVSEPEADADLELARLRRRDGLAEEGRRQHEAVAV